MDTVRKSLIIGGGVLASMVAFVISAVSITEKRMDDESSIYCYEKLDRLVSGEQRFAPVAKVLLKDRILTNRECRTLDIHARLIRKQKQVDDILAKVKS